MASVRARQGHLYLQVVFSVEVGLGFLEAPDFSVLPRHSALVNTMVPGPVCKDMLGLFTPCLLHFTYNSFILLN